MDYKGNAAGNTEDLFDLTDKFNALPDVAEFRQGQAGTGRDGVLAARAPIETDGRRTGRASAHCCRRPTRSITATQGLRAFSIQPGGIQTGLLQYMSEEEKSGLTTDPTLGLQFKSLPQGAATSVWAALSRSLEGMGGKYLEDVQIAKVYDASEGQWAPGYFPHAYSSEKEKKLWDVALKLVFVDE